MGRLENVQFAQIKERQPGFPGVYIETGLWMGEQLVIAAAHFKQVHGIELDKHWAEVSTKAARHLPHVEVIHGDSRDHLPILLDRYESVPCFIQLDAHYCDLDPPIQKSEFPLWRELELIKGRKTSDIVLVDDTHTFGRERPELRFKPGSKEWETVTAESILAFFGDEVVDSLEIGGAFCVWRRSLEV